MGNSDEQHRGNAMKIRKAMTHDVPTIGKIINDCAEYGLMLHRSQSFLYEHVREFHVVETKGEVVGVCGLSIVWAALAEVYALAVASAFRGQGLGKQLVSACVDEAHHLGVGRLMTLTYEVRFFESCGFQKADRHKLPLKVWGDCVRCAKNQACDEVAMLRTLESQKPPTVSLSPPVPEGRVEMPVVLGVEPERIGRRPKMDEAH